MQQNQETKKDSPTPWLFVAYGVLIGLLAAALILIVAAPHQGKAIQLIPAPTAGPLSVHVSGAVQKPGIYTLPEGSRVNDAISAAGGLTNNANSEALNLAAYVTDGQKIEVYLMGQALPTSVPGGAGLPNAKININTATVQELDQLPGIGPAKAESIVSYREQNGPFQSIDEIQNVPGIGASIFDQIKEYLTVGNN